MKKIEIDLEKLILYSLWKHLVRDFLTEEERNHIIYKKFIELKEGSFGIKLYDKVMKITLFCINIDGKKYFLLKFSEDSLIIKKIIKELK